MSRRPVFLLGFMGCGKSTVGPRVAREFACRFVDLDDEIERRTDRTITVLFNELGESGFREIESRELRRVTEMRDVIIACGGGIVTESENRRVLAGNGMSVYLRLPPQELVRRLETSTDRPMLYGHAGGRLDPEALTERIETLLAARESFYLMADVVIDVSNMTVEEVVGAVVEAIRSGDTSD